MHYLSQPFLLSVGIRWQFVSICTLSMAALLCRTAMVVNFCSDTICKLWRIFKSFELFHTALKVFIFEIIPEKRKNINSDTICVTEEVQIHCEFFRSHTFCRTCSIAPLEYLFRIKMCHAHQSLSNCITFPQYKISLSLKMIHNLQRRTQKRFSNIIIW